MLSATSDIATSLGHSNIPRPRALPSFICEISWGQSTLQVEEKTVRYIKCNKGQIATVLVIKLEYPKSRWAAVGMLVLRNLL